MNDIIFVMPNTKTVKPILSIIIPAKNEEKRIGKTLSTYGSFFAARKFDMPTEIIVVVNNSSDSTAKKVDTYSKQYPFIKRIETHYASGKGGAVAMGFSQAQGDYIGFVDADGAVSASEIHDLYHFIEETPWLDGVIGNRKLGASIIGIQRRALMKLFNLAVKVLFGLPYSDTQCGAKIFRRRAAQEIAKKLTNTGWAFDVNLLLVAKYLNFQILERPVTWLEKDGSKYSLVDALINVPTELLALKLNEFAYNLNNTTSRFFSHEPRLKEAQGTKNILIYAWRDIKHPDRGGSEVYVHEIGKRLAKKHKVTLFTSQPGNLSDRDQIDGIEIVRKGGTLGVYFWAFIYYILFFKNDTDFIIDVQNGIPFFTPLFSSKPKVMVLHHVHKNQWFKQPPFKIPLFGFFVSLIGYFIEVVVMPIVYSSTKCVTVSPSSFKEMKHLGFKDKNIYTVYNSIPTKIGRTLPESPTPLLLYVGRVKAYKRLETAIDTINVLKREFPTLKLIIGGRGDHEDILKQYVKKLGLEKNVTILGSISETKKWELMQQAWLFLMPSLQEGWGITILEASSCGTPSIGYNVVGVRDSIRDGITGLLAKEGSKKDFSDKVRFLINDKQQRKYMATNCKVWAKAFSWNKSAAVFQDIIDSHFINEHLLTDKKHPWELDASTEAITTLANSTSSEVLTTLRL